jgi:quinol monooxygenase YgiN
MITENHNWAFILEYEFPPLEIPDLIGLGKVLQEYSRQEPGCLYYQIHQLEGEPHKVITYQVFENENAVNHHLESEHYLEIGIRKIAPKIISKKITRLVPLISKKG